MKRMVPAVLGSNPVAPDPAAYPLAALSYAVTAPSTLDAAAGKDYAAFVRYAAGPGQQSGIEPGQLPPGMAPLPAALKAQAVAAAATIETQAGKTTGGPPAQQLTLPGDVPGGPIGSTGGPNPAPGPAGTTTSSGGGPSAPGASVLHPRAPVVRSLRHPTWPSRSPRRGARRRCPHLRWERCFLTS